MKIKSISSNIISNKINQDRKTNNTPLKTTPLKYDCISFSANKTGLLVSEMMSDFGKKHMVKQININEVKHTEDKSFEFTIADHTYKMEYEKNKRGKEKITVSKYINGKRKEKGNISKSTFDFYFKNAKKETYQKILEDIGFMHKLNIFYKQLGKKLLDNNITFSSPCTFPLDPVKGQGLGINLPKAKMFISYYQTPIKNGETKEEQFLKITSWDNNNISMRVDKDENFFKLFDILLVNNDIRIHRERTTKIANELTKANKELAQSISKRNKLENNFLKD